ncbi:hypothetical protein FRC07_002617 [Ceratobasidium sp. 392]|nr:hypothetical protein FRC07_002617 [Ceratobasidium sp. 392]
MAIAWFVCGFLIYELIPRLTFMEALLIAACITPTDPVLANSITKGRSEEFSAPNRHLSGIIARWIYETWLYQIVLSVILGLAIGWIARKSLRWCEERRMLDEDNFVAYGTGLSFFCLGFLGIMGSDDLLCCFIAGNSFSWDDRQRLAAEDAGFQDIIDLLLNAYKLIPAIPSIKEAIFVGWFGPIGVSAIFYVQVALEYLPKDSREQVKSTIEPVVYFMVFTSILVHGITVPATKVLMQGVTLTRTFTQPTETAKRPTEPIHLDSIRRIGVPTPILAYDTVTGERVVQNVELIGTPGSSEPSTRRHTRAGTPLQVDEGRDVEAAIATEHEGRTVADGRQRLAAEDAGFQDIIDLLLNAAIFVYTGAIVPWYAFNDLMTGITPWRIIVLVALEYLSKDSREQIKLTIKPIVYFMVFTSILVHGIIAPASKLLVHSVTLTRTLTHPSEAFKGPMEPVKSDSIQYIGIAVPILTYDNATGERVV